jgi:hypothetical protein
LPSTQPLHFNSVVFESDMVLGVTAFLNVDGLGIWVGHYADDFLLIE